MNVMIGNDKAQPAVSCLEWLMLEPSAIRRAIDEVELAVENLPPDRPTPVQSGSALGKLYTVYAQSVLNAHGIMADLDDLCCQCCRVCPPGDCFRDRNRA
ncbi:hypothetical protein [Azospirillum cavernae]|nr:hypothetical protein [Azospirillum cavernae]